MATSTQILGVFIYLSPFFVGCIFGLLDNRKPKQEK